MQRSSVQFTNSVQLLSTEKKINTVKWWRPVQSPPLKGNVHVTSEQRRSHTQNQVLRLQEKFLSERSISASHLQLSRGAQERSRRCRARTIFNSFLSACDARTNAKFCLSLKATIILGRGVLAPHCMPTNYTHDITHYHTPDICKSHYEVAARKTL